MKTIIAPVDFSEIAHNAALYAADMAHYLHADLILMHVIPIPLMALDVPIPGDAYDTERTEAFSKLTRMKHELHERTQDKVTISFQVTFGTFMEQLNALIANDTFAVVMGTKGVGAAAFLLGSNTVSAARHLSCPLLIVPPGSRFKEIKKIALTTDMDDIRDTLPFVQIREICDEFHAGFDVLCVSLPDEQVYRHVLMESRHIYNNLGRFHPEIKITVNENIFEGIKSLIREREVDLLFVFPKSRNFLERIFHKSTTRQLIAEPVIPFIILKS